MNRTVRISLLLLLSATASLIWLRPAPAPVPPTVRITIPVSLSDNSAQRDNADGLWRVVTQRVLTQDAIRSLQNQLKAMGLTPLTLRTKEDVTLHAFDDPGHYTTYEEAEKAGNIWKGLGIQADVIKSQEGIYVAGLGRFYQSHYAEGLLIRLKETGKPFRYEQRTIPIPVWRFTFPAAEKTAAEKLWKQLSESGVIMPVLIPEIRYRELYGDISPE
ncbi:hypothetical protein Ga0123462_0665 [Mariprofundus ferrinatatus]|uniref:Sporulation related domain-containing protein n=1 Tax=Mariprofundus ferrinatatus TaxID=1921087 RepID=A0A2K8L2I4_9PROT|nr:hypothetical protein [Mariprofundus ferrinatatus]ATX81535.1 hypothetical protein Ga0123462_0665 [Mariprofundus ferrinatatus]